MHWFPNFFFSPLKLAILPGKKLNAHGLFNLFVYQSCQLWMKSRMWQMEELWIFLWCPPALLRLNNTTEQDKFPQRNCGHMSAQLALGLPSVILNGMTQQTWFLGLMGCLESWLLCSWTNTIFRHCTWTCDQNIISREIKKCRARVCINIYNSSHGVQVKCCFERAFDKHQSLQNTANMVNCSCNWNNFQRVVGSIAGQGWWTTFLANDVDASTTNPLHWIKNHQLHRFNLTLETMFDSHWKSMWLHWSDLRQQRLFCFFTKKKGDMEKHVLLSEDVHH